MSGRPKQKHAKKRSADSTPKSKQTQKKKNRTTSAGRELARKKEYETIFNKEFPHYQQWLEGQDPDELFDIPLPGHTTKTGETVIYSTLANETPLAIANKLGVPNWRWIVGEPRNLERYGILFSTTTFFRGTQLVIPPRFSKSAVSEIFTQSPDDEAEVCRTCRTNNGQPSDILMCDGCDAPYHFKCVGLASVPEEEWFCTACVQVLDARKYYQAHPMEFQNNAYQLPPAPNVKSSTSPNAQELRIKLQRYLKLQKWTTSLPFLLGQITITQERDDASLLQVLINEKVVIFVPTVPNAKKNEAFLSLFSLRVSQTYSVFATRKLFDGDRDDEIPLVRNGIRDAQRCLFRLLTTFSNDTENQGETMTISKPAWPTSVRPRHAEPMDNDLANDPSHLKCFDLNELVDDCKADLDLPRQSTPEVMSSNGYLLRGYQESSLRWMLDKEKEALGIGLAGELWHRLRFADVSEPSCPEEYFYCSLTNSFSLDIFNFQEDSGQANASTNRFHLPTGSILGLEMGLGKTPVAIALILANPPPDHRRALPRETEFLVIDKKGDKIKNPKYRNLPQVGPIGTKDDERSVLSNGTLVVAPLNLIGQWETEVKKFAPQMNVVLLHSQKIGGTLVRLADANVVLVPTTLLQSLKKEEEDDDDCGELKKPNARLQRIRELQESIKSIFWHRIIVDEAHQQGQSSTISKFVASLHANHRHSLTGTPLGGSLMDFQGQLHLLRLHPFSRPKFWEQNVAKPFSEGNNPEALRVLRSLLSHVVYRHGKEQTGSSGQTLLDLPQCSVESIPLTPESEHEKMVFDRTQALLEKLFDQAKKATTADDLKFYCGKLNRLLYEVRRACIHPALLSLEKVDRAIAIGGISQTSAKKGSFKGEKKSRQELLRSAEKKARPDCKIRMLKEIKKYQGGEHGDGKLLECPLCLENVDEQEVALLPCSHGLCKECALQLTGDATSRAPSCPTCRDVFRQNEVTFLGDAKDIFAPAKLHNYVGVARATDSLTTPISATAPLVNVSPPNTRELEKMIEEGRKETQMLDPALLSGYYIAKCQVGTKMAWVLREIKAMIKADESNKCVVFSQHTDMMESLGMELEARGIKSSGLCGNMHHRSDTLSDFESDPSLKVMLLSIRGGAEGLNLLSANYCFLLDVVKNVSIERQAVGRIHRFGQTRPVIVKQCLIKDSVEERFLAMRNAKSNDGSGVRGDSCEQEEETELSTLRRLIY